MPPLNNAGSQPLPKRVLFVDDDEQLLQAIRVQLENSIEVHCVNSGPAALEVLDEVEFPVVITDMVMEAMNGIEFILAAREKSPQSVFMLLTALRDRETGVKALNEANVFCVINKPCTTAELVNFIDAGYAAYRRKVTPS